MHAAKESISTVCYCTQKAYQIFVKSFPLYQDFEDRGLQICLSSLPTAYTTFENHEYKIQKNLLIPVLQENLSFLKVHFTKHFLHILVESTNIPYLDFM